MLHKHTFKYRTRDIGGCCVENLSNILWLLLWNISNRAQFTPLLDIKSSWNIKINAHICQLDLLRLENKTMVVFFPKGEMGDSISNISSEKELALTSIFRIWKTTYIKYWFHRKSNACFFFFSLFLLLKHFSTPNIVGHKLIIDVPNDLSYVVCITLGY